MRFQFPWAFLLIPVLLPVFWFACRSGRQGTLRFSALSTACAVGASWRTRWSALPLFIRMVAVLFLIVALARPQQGREEVRDVSKGIAIEMVVDRSGSMGQELSYQGAQLNRLDVVKRVFKEFVLGNGKDLKGRPNDLIGMVAFARYADTICPMTLSHGALDRFIDNILVVTRKNEDGTAIGDALALAAARLKTAEERGEGYKIKSKVIILLTDGQNNAGRRSPQEAARLAREWGIKVYAVGVGGRESFATVRTPFGEYKVPAGPGVDEATLKTIAAETGGAYWLAESAGKLYEVYKEIDKLERTEIESVRYVDYSERFIPFLMAALLALCLEQALLCTAFRRIP